MSDAFTFALDTHTQLRMKTHTRITTVRTKGERNEKPCVLEKYLGCAQQSLYLCPLSYRTSHPQHTATTLPSSCTHTHHSHSAIPLTSAPVCRDHSGAIGKGGNTRCGEGNHIWRSLPAAAPHVFFNRTSEHTHECCNRDYNMPLSVRLTAQKWTGGKSVTGFCKWDGSVAKGMWVGVVGEMSRETAIDTVTMWTEPQNTSPHQQPSSSQVLESSQQGTHKNNKD